MTRFINKISPAVLFFFALAFCLPTGASAETPGTDNGGWGGEAEIGYLMTTGNTSTQSLNARLGIGNDTPRWQNTFVFESLYGSEESEETGEEETTVQRFLLSGKTNYKFDSRNFTYGQVLLEDDRFSGYEYQVTSSVGYRRILINNDRMEWAVELGPGYRYSRFDDDLEEEEGDYESEIIVHGGTQFNYALSDTASFRQEISVGAGTDNTIIRSTTAMRAAIIGSLSMKLSFNLKHTANEPAESSSTDTETALTLVYGF